MHRLHLISDVKPPHFCFLEIECQWGDYRAWQDSIGNAVGRLDG